MDASLTQSAALVRDAPTPLYRQLAEALAGRMASGALAPFERLPSEQALQDEFQVSRVTVRLALKELGSRGLIESHKGRGSFVAGSVLTQNMQVPTGFYDLFLAQGLEPQTHLIAFDARCSPAGEDARLASTSDTVCRFTRVYVLQGRPVGLVSAAVCELDRAFTRDTVERLPVYGLLQQVAGVAIVRADVAVKTRVADRASAQALELREGDPLLAIRRVSFDDRCRAVEATTFHIRPEHFEFRFSVQGPVPIAPAIRLVPKP